MTLVLIHMGTFLAEEFHRKLRMSFLENLSRVYIKSDITLCLKIDLKSYKKNIKYILLDIFM